MILFGPKNKHLRSVVRIITLAIVFFFKPDHHDTSSLIKVAFEVVSNDKICGHSLSSDHSRYCVINRMIDKNPCSYEHHINETVCHVSPQKFEFSKRFL